MKRKRKLGGMTYKPIELRPLGPLRAENQEENVGEQRVKMPKEVFHTVLSQV